MDSNLSDHQLKLYMLQTEPVLCECYGNNKPKPIIDTKITKKKEPKQITKKAINTQERE